MCCISFVLWTGSFLLRVESILVVLNLVIVGVVGVAKLLDETANLSAVVVDFLYFVKRGCKIQEHETIG